jgi:outer membrane lipoprotein-sorting protein
MGGRLVPTTLVVQPTDKPDEHTTITYADLEFNVGLEPSFFSLRRLQESRGTD